MAVVGQHTLMSDGFADDTGAMPFDSGYFAYEYQCNSWELPVGAVLAEPGPSDAVVFAHGDGWADLATAAASSSSSTVLSFDGHGEEYCTAWMDAHATEQQACFSPAAAAAVTVPPAASSVAVVGAAGTGSQKRRRAPPPHCAEQEAKKQCGGNRKAEAATKMAPSTPPKEPQSLAAKNRRERISERLKELQELVPNGSKVDMVTMLEKAFSYVKFLQVQLKVLETDAFWPAHDGKAPDVSQVKEALDAILLSSSSQPQGSRPSS